MSNSMKAYNESDYVKVGRAMGLIPPRQPNLTKSVERNRRKGSLKMTHGAAHQDMPTCYRITAEWAVDDIKQETISTYEARPGRGYEHCYYRAHVASLSFGKVEIGVSRLEGESRWYIDSYFVGLLPHWCHGTGSRAGLNKRSLDPASIPARLLSASVRAGMPVSTPDPEPWEECDEQGFLPLG